MDNARAEILEGLNVFRALETWGATLYAAWAADEPDARLRTDTLPVLAPDQVVRRADAARATAG